MPSIRRILPRWLVASATIAALTPTAATQQMVDAPYLAGFLQPVAFAFHGDHRLYVCERRGVVRTVDHGTPVPAPLLDISDEVGSWRDYGLLGFALDPDFANNGFYYLSYVVDRHHLLHAGTPGYDPGFDQYYAATIVRVTRYTADSATGFTTTVPGSRHVLFGETPSTGAPLVHESHGSGQLLFGRDGTLLVAIGDGAHFHLGGDFGNDPQTYDQQALADGILRPEENVGVWRAQMLSSHSGKILRLDPTTGDGVPSNPFFDAAQPRAPRSRIYALGFRNPFRMTLRPDTGATDPTLGRPGTIYVGDVGWYTREELDVVTAPGQNFGWPLFEGIEPNPLYVASPTANPEAPNPLAGSGGCNVPFFRFQDLLHQAESGHTASFPNPCDGNIAIPASVPTFEHALPVLDWHHSWDDVRVPVFENGVLVTRLLGSPSSGIPGPQFHGGASVGGCWHSGLSFPASYGPCYYHADYGIGWIRRFQFDAQDRLLAVHDLTQTVYPVMLLEDPDDHALLYLGLNGDQFRAVRFGVEPEPTAVPQATVARDGATVTAQLDARASSDPEGQPLTYLWQLGNGRTSTAPQLGFAVRATGTPSSHPVQLTVTDSNGASATATLPIALDNTPPRVAITSFADGGFYSRTAPTIVPLQANVQDDEHGAAQLTYSWRTTLHHGTHVHPEQPVALPSTTAQLSPTSAGAEFFAYSIALTVTDAAGLATTARHWLFPDPTGASTSVLMTAPANGDRVDAGATIAFGAITTGNVARVEYYVDGELVGIATAPPWTCALTTDTGGRHTAMALAIAADGTSSNTGGVAFTVDAPTVLQVRVQQSSADATEAIGQPAPPQTTASALVLGDDGTPWLTGLSFALPALPEGARVTAAHVDFTAAAADASAAQLAIAADLHPSALPIRARPKDLQSRKVGTGIAWSPQPWLAAGAADLAERTPDLAALLQPLVAAPKWQHRVLLLFSGTGQRRAIAWDGDRSVAPLLTVHWLPPLLPTHSILPVADACEETATGTVDLAAAALPLGTVAGAARLDALQFALDVPPGARIESARVQFSAAAADLGPAVLTWRVEDSDDAAPLVSAAADLSARPRIATAVVWHPAEWPTVGARGPEQLSPELAPLMQAIVDRTFWRAGRAITLFVDGSGSRTAASADSNGTDAPRLLVRWRAL